MEVEEPPAVPSAPPPRRRLPSDPEEQVRMKKQTLQAVLEQCQRALELLNTADDQDPDLTLEVGDGGGGGNGMASQAEESDASDRETDALCELIKSKVDSPAFLEKFGSIRTSVCEDISESNASWDIVTTTDLWGDKRADEQSDSDEDDYVLVNQEDIADGLACFMAACLLSLKQTKELTPNQLQEALSKTFSAKKKKSKLHKAWDGSKVLYNVASWGATAIGLYQNPAVVQAASVAFWSSCRVISKLI